MSGAQRTAALAEANRLKAERLLFMKQLRNAASVEESTRLCADLIERRPECLLSAEVHELLEECLGLGPAGADAVQEAVGMFRAYTLRELPHSKAAAVVAILRMRSVGRVPSARRMALTTARRARDERKPEALEMLARGKPAAIVADILEIAPRTVRRWRDEARALTEAREAQTA